MFGGEFSDEGDDIIGDMENEVMRTTTSTPRTRLSVDTHTHTHTFVIHVHTHNESTKVQNPRRNLLHHALNSKCPRAKDQQAVLYCACA